MLSDCEKDAYSKLLREYKCPLVYQFMYKSGNRTYIDDFNVRPKETFFVFHKTGDTHYFDLGYCYEYGNSRAEFYSLGFSCEILDRQDLGSDAYGGLISAINKKSHIFGNIFGGYAYDIIKGWHYFADLNFSYLLNANIQFSNDTEKIKFVNYFAAKNKPTQ